MRLPPPACQTALWRYGSGVLPTRSAAAASLTRRGAAV